MYLLPFLCLSLVFLVGCEQNSTPSEMEEVERMVQLVEEEPSEWNLPEDRSIASGESGIEETAVDSLHEEAR